MDGRTGVLAYGRMDGWTPDGPPWYKPIGSDDKRVKFKNDQFVGMIK